MFPKICQVIRSTFGTILWRERRRGAKSGSSRRRPDQALARRSSSEARRNHRIRRTELGNQHAARLHWVRTLHSLWAAAKALKWGVVVAAVRRLF